MGRGKGREFLFSLSSSRHCPRVAVFPLPRPTAKKTRRIKKESTQKFEQKVEVVLSTSLRPF